MSEEAKTGDGKVPSGEFWTNEMEFDSTRAEHDFAQDGASDRWLEKLSGQQVRMLCRLLNLKHADSIQKIRPPLHDQAAKDLTPFYLVEQFGRGKSEVAILEVAQEALPPEVVALCIRQKRESRKPGKKETPPEDRYDKNALLFALYAKSPKLLKEVFHFDKVHKKGFASMAMDKAAHHPPKASFKAFLTEKAIRETIEAYQKPRRDGSLSELQGIWVREERCYVFIRRTERPGHIHDGHRGIVHGYRPEWIVLDFSPDGDQVNIASHSIDEPREIAELIAGRFFGCPCNFVNEEKKTDVKIVKKFIAAARASDNGIGLVEACVANSPLNGASKVRISNDTTKSLRESLDQIDKIAGELMGNLANVEWIKVLYRDKRVGLLFHPDELDDAKCEVRYTDQRLNAFERRKFEQEMRTGHGIHILSTEKR